MLLCCYLVVTISGSTVTRKASRAGIREVQDHLRRVNNVPEELYCVISFVSETVGLVEASGTRVILLDL